MKVFWKLLIITVLLAFPVYQSVLIASALETPPDFTLLLSDHGVELYRKDYADGNPDLVQRIDLSQGTAIKLLYGSIASLGEGEGVYDGDNPTIDRQSLPTVWEQFLSTNNLAFCVTNGQFFSTNEDPTKLAFPLKVGGRITSDGYGISEFPDQKLMLEIWESRVDIVPLTQNALYSSTAPNIIAGLTEDANKGPANPTGRTFIGIDDSNTDGQFETILIFNSKTATQPDAAKVLRDFGADKLIMLDGGGSTQLICGGVWYVESNRTVPQTIATVRGIVLDPPVDPPPEPAPPSFWQDIQRQISEWFRRLQAAIQEWWGEQQQGIADWWQRFLANIEAEIAEMIEEAERQTVEWIETEMQSALEQLLNQLCGTALLPGFTIIWWCFRSTRKARAK